MQEPLHTPQPPTAQVPDRPWRKHRRLPKGTLVAAGLLLLLLLAIYFVLPERLPAIGKLLTAFVFSIAAMLVPIFAFSELGRKVPRVELPLLGKTKPGSLVGGIVFLLSMAWWLSPWAPIQIGRPAAADVARQLADEIETVLLVLPQTDVAVPKAPLPPASARAAAAHIRSGSPYQLALKSIVENRFEEGRKLLDRATQEKDGDPLDVQVARAHLEMFACRFAEAGPLYDELIAAQPRNVGLHIQAAVAALYAGQLERARRLSAQVLVTARATLTSEDPLLAKALNLALAVEVMQGNYSEAARYVKQAQELGLSDAPGEGGDAPRETVVGAVSQKDVQLATSINNRAVLATLQGKYSGAVVNAQWADETWQKIYGSRSAHRAVTLHNRAVLDMTRAEYDRAERRLHESLMMRRESLAPTHPDIAVGLVTQAELQHLLGRYAEAEQTARQALNGLELTLAPEHAGILTALRTQASAIAAAGNFEEADLRLQRLLATGQRTFTPGHPFLALTRKRQAELYLDQERVDEAKQLAEAALTLCEARLGNDHPSTAEVQTTLGAIYLRNSDNASQRKGKELVASAQKVLNKAFQALADRHLGLAANKAALAPAYNSPRGILEARKLYGEATKIVQAAAGSEHPWIADFQEGMGGMYVARRDDPAAERFYRPALELRQNVLAADHPHTARVMEAYAGVLRRTNREQQAEQLEAEAAEMRKRHAEAVDRAREAREARERGR